LTFPRFFFRSASDPSSTLLTTLFWTVTLIRGFSANHAYRPGIASLDFFLDAHFSWPRLSRFLIPLVARVRRPSGLLPSSQCFPLFFTSSFSVLFSIDSRQRCFRPCSSLPVTSLTGSVLFFFSFLKSGSCGRRRLSACLQWLAFTSIRSRDSSVSSFFVRHPSRFSRTRFVVYLCSLESILRIWSLSILDLSRSWSSCSGLLSFLLNLAPRSVDEQRLLLLFISKLPALPFE